MIESIVEQHFESAVTAWITSDFARRAFHFSLRDLAELDGVRESYFAGLQLSDDLGRELAAVGLQREEPGEVFVAAVLAIKLHDEERIEQMMESVGDSAELRRAVISALGWLPWDQAGPLAIRWSASDGPFRRYAGVAAFEIHRVDPEDRLTDWLQDSDPDVRARALQAVGTLARSDLLDAVQVHVDDPGELIRTCACRTAAFRLRRDGAISQLMVIAQADGPCAERAARLLMSVLPVENACELIQRLAKGNEGQVRLAIILMGLLGIPDSVPWLIEVMTQPPFARVAGESFYRITGLRLDQRPFEGDWPEGFEAGPNDDPEDENVEMDEDEDLPWPEPVPIAAWWEENRSRFRSNVRYLLGFELDNEVWLQKILVLGRQRERATAALELAIRNPTEPLFNVEEHGRRQMKKLGVKRLPTEEYRCNHIEAGPDDHTWKKYLRKPS